MQIADSGRVFTMASVRQARPWIMIALSIKSPDAVLHTEINVDEGITDTPAVVEAKLGFTKAITAARQLAVSDEVVGPQIRQAAIDRRLAECITMDNTIEA